MAANGTNALDPINWGTSTGGAAGSAETSSTLGVARIDTRTVPDQYHVWGLQLTALISLGLAASATFKGGTRLGTLTQTASPFGSTEQGFWVDTSNNPKFSAGGISSTVPINTGTTAAQATNVNTNVIINASAGTITTQSASTAARTAEAGFVVSNSAVLATSVVIARVIAYSGTLFTNGQPDIDITAIAGGSFNCRIINRDATNALAGTMKIHFVVL